MTEMTVDRVIDARGMACPGPLMSLIGAIRQAQVGQVLEVWSTDAGSATDIPAWVAKARHELVEGADEFYSLEGALRLREALRRFGGGRVLVGVAGIPYKCPPAPVEFTLMLDQYLRKRGVRDKSEVTLLSPLNRAFTIEPASKLVQPLMEARGIGLETFFNVESVDPAAGTVSSLEGDKAAYDLLVLVPPHAGQAVVEASGLGDAGGWVPT